MGGAGEVRSIKNHPMWRLVRGSGLRFSQLRYLSTKAKKARTATARQGGAERKPVAEHSDASEF